MKSCCDDSCASDTGSTVNPNYKKILIIALLLNVLMCIIEIITGLSSGSAALLADSLDFTGDAANFALGLFVLQKSLLLRAKASLLKAAVMGVFGLFVIGLAIHHYYSGTVPEAPTMGVVSILALLVNGTVAFLLYRHRAGDSNRLSVWLCARNDAFGNIAVLLAALAVHYTSSNIPDLLVAVVMGGMGISASLRIRRKVKAELQSLNPQDQL